jgi:hypothetical protein
MYVCRDITGALRDFRVRKGQTFCNGRMDGPNLLFEGRLIWAA